MQRRTTGAHQIDLDLVERFMELAVCFRDYLVHRALPKDHWPGVALRSLSKDFTDLDKLQ